jgi:Family of unknown function (DUF5946)
MIANKDAYDELCCYTLAHGDPAFIHQHVVDAFAAQDATSDDKPIRLTFALVGLYLHVERGFTGREVQLAHMKLGRRKQKWPTFNIPQDRGLIDATIVLAAPIDQRDEMIHQWCHSVWKAFSDQRGEVERLLGDNGITDVQSVRWPARAMRLRGH